MKRYKNLERVPKSCSVPERLFSPKSVVTASKMRHWMDRPTRQRRRKRKKGIWSLTSFEIPTMRRWVKRSLSADPVPGSKKNHAGSKRKTTYGHFRFHT